MTLEGVEYNYNAKTSEKVDQILPAMALLGLA